MKQIIILILVITFSQQFAGAEGRKTNLQNKNNTKGQSIIIRKTKTYPPFHSLNPLTITKRRMGPDIILGINTGVNYSNITGSEDGLSKIAINPFIGIFGRLKFSEATAYQLNIN